MAGKPARKVAWRFQRVPGSWWPRLLPRSRTSACTLTPASASSPQRRGRASPVPTALFRDPPCPRPRKGRIIFLWRQKIDLPPSVYTFSYPAREIQPAARPWHSQGHVSPIKFGDLRSNGSISEQKHAYSAPDKRTLRVYDKECAASQTHRRNLQLGDGCTRFSTSTSELFPVHNLGRTDRRNLAPKPDLLLQKHRSNVCLGDDCSGSRFFSTTQQSDYRPPRRSQRVMADSKSHRESHIAFNYHTDESSVTTMQAVPVPHRLQKQRLSEDMLQQIEYSHLGLPWRVQDLFRTEQKDEFTPKSRGPAEIQKANSQVSCVPLGTLKGYCPQRKVLFAP